MKKTQVAKDTEQAGNRRADGNKTRFVSITRVGRRADDNDGRVAGGEIEPG